MGHTARLSNEDGFLTPWVVFVIVIYCDLLWFMWFMWLIVVIDCCDWLLWLIVIVVIVVIDLWFMIICVEAAPRAIQGPDVQNQDCQSQDYFS